MNKETIKSVAEALLEFGYVLLVGIIGIILGILLFLILPYLMMIVTGIIVICGFIFTIIGSILYLIVSSILYIKKLVVSRSASYNVDIQKDVDQ